MRRGGGLRLLDEVPGDDGILKLLEAGKVVVETWVKKVLEFSFLGEMRESGLKFLEVSRQQTNDRGMWMESASYLKPAQGLERELAEPMMKQVMPRVERVLFPALEKKLRAANYLGPVGVDSFFYEDDGLKWQPVVEVNARWSMGRVAREWRLKLCPDRCLKMRLMKKEEASGMVMGDVESLDEGGRVVVLDF